MWGRTCFTIPISDPKSVWNVPDLKLTLENDKQVAKWGVPGEYKWCKPSYHVRVETDIYDYTITTSKNNYAIALEKYCFYLNVHVQVSLKKVFGRYVETGPTEFGKY